MGINAMKTKIFLSALFIFVSLGIYSQIPAVTGAQCVECGGMNGDHKTWCSSYNPGVKAAPSSSGSSINIQQQIMLNIFSRMLSNADNNHKKSEQQKEQELAQQKKDDAVRQQHLAALLEKQKKYNDSIAQANHDRMMKDYKPLNGTGDLSYKGLDDKQKVLQVHFNCKITSFSGNVVVIKSNGKEIKLSETQSADLAPGDWIATGENSRIKLHYAFENGGEDMTLSSKTVINIEANEDGTQLPKLMRGKMYVVKNSGERQYHQEGEGITDQATFEANKLKAAIENRFIKMSVRTPGAALAIRGTEFTVNVDDFSDTEVNVKNGVVELTGDLSHGTITLTAGKKGIVKATGEIEGPMEMDETQFESMDDHLE